MAKSPAMALELRSLGRRLLTSAEFSRLQDVPPEAEWFANLESPGTRRIYKTDIRDFMKFAAIRESVEFRLVTRAHVIAPAATQTPPPVGRSNSST